MASLFWRTSSKGPSSGLPTPSTSGESSPAGRQEEDDIKDAMEAVNLIMNDDIEGAEARLRLRDDASAFHQLGLGLAVFMRSIIGFEKDIMAEATRRLGDCESRAWADMKKAQGGGGYWWGAKKTGGGVSEVYPPGSEFALIHAESQLMNAIVAVMSESLTEGLRGFYKLRKAFATLNGIKEAELQYFKSRSPQSEDQEKLAELTLESDHSALDQLDRLGGAASTPFKSTADVFVHSGTSMVLGLLLLILSIVPPAFSRLLSVVGFKGDRQRGIRMLWQSTKFPNVHGACAALGLLLYYNALFGFVDVMPTDRDLAELGSEDDEMVGYQQERCQALLADMRERYPASGLWRLEEARMKANSKQLDQAIDMLQGNETAKMRQVVALNAFELSMNAMFSLRWELVRDGFLRSVELSDWSAAIHYYMAAGAELELYRDARVRVASLSDGSEEHAEAALKAEALKTSAQELFRRVPGSTGKKRFMTRTMPMEVFVARKVQKWEDRAKALAIDLADAVAFSPALEMVYVFNGAKRMSPALLQRALDHVAWDRCTAGPDALASMRAEKDEDCIRAVSEATLLRCLGRTADARAAVEPFLHMDRHLFKGPTKDDYGLPAAHYEVAAAAWAEASLPELWPANSEEVDEFRRKKVNECAECLTRLAAWETYVLDSRFSMRIGVGLDSVKWLKGKKKWV